MVMPKGALDGIRVVDLSSVIMGPFAAQLLGDMGADIIKVESREGDQMRVVGPRRNEGMASVFLNINRNKRGMVLNLKDSGGREVLDRLIAKADIVIQSNRTSAMKRLRLDYDSLKAINPQIIACQVKGFTDAGAYGGRPALDDIIQALSGFAMLQSVIGGEPRYVPSAIADKVCAVYAALAMSMAIIHRLRTGEGQQVELPMLETMVAFATTEHIGGYVFDPPIENMGYGSIRAGSRRPYKTRDGYLAFLPYTDAHWTIFTRLIGKPELMQDPRFKDFDSRTKAYEASFGEVASQLALKTSAEWTTLLNGHDIPFAVVNDLESLATDPHLESVDFWKFHNHSTEGRLRMANIPMILSASPGTIRRMAPNLGEHTREILAEAGYSATEIEALLAQGIAYAA
jgi:crotonobetainyl-CoA:carnitine CoA-transferase CaiB-like acyl-CoA transferase